MAIWDEILTRKDKAAFEKGGMRGRRVGFGTKPAILVIDMSRGFVEPEFPLAAAKRPEETIRAVGRLLSVGRKKKTPIFFTTIRTPHTDADWGRWKAITLRTHPELKDDATWEIISDLSPREGETVLLKTRPSGFFATDLANLLIYQKVDTVIISGMTTSGCVRATVVDAFSYNFRVIVPFECVADRADLSHRVSLLDIHMKYGDVVSLKEVIQHLSNEKKKGQPKGKTDHS